MCCISNTWFGITYYTIEYAISYIDFVKTIAICIFHCDWKLAMQQQKFILIFVCWTKYIKLTRNSCSCFAPIFGVNRDWATDWKFKKIFIGIFKLMKYFFLKYHKLTTQKRW